MAKKSKGPSKSREKTSSRVKKGKAAYASRKVVEPSSGPESSALDPKRSKILRVEENDPTVIKGRMSGDVQNLSAQELDDSESVEELVEEGQDLEGELVQGVENAPPADQGEVKTHAPAEPDDEVPDYKHRNRL
jgi:hypothetical protein